MEKIVWEKQQLRKVIKEKRKELSGEEIKTKSKRITEKFISLPEFEKSRKVMFYLSFNQEVSTGEMVDRSLQLGKQVLVPKIEEGELSVWTISDRAQCHPNRWGIPEPAENIGVRLFTDWKGIELIVTPGLAFDFKGNRLGYGRGYYDRFFNRLPKTIFAVGLAFEFQLFDKLPVGRNDFSVDCVITEKRSIAV